MITPRSVASFTISSLLRVSLSLALAAAAASAQAASDWVDHNRDGRIDTYEKSTASIDDRVADLIGQMTLEEKIGQMTQLNAKVLREGGGLSADALQTYVHEQGIGSYLRLPSGLAPAAQAAAVSQVQAAAAQTRLGIPVLFGQNATYGYADMQGATVFPGGIGMASSWNPDLIKRTAQVTAAECAAVGVYWTFGPVLGVGREPRWGRIGETFGEDPYLASVMGFHQIKGYQGDSLADPLTIMATAKHFVANSVPERGLNHNRAEVSDRSLREIFLPPFRAAVQAGVGSFMAAHNEVGGMPCHANAYLLTEVLRGELGFEGVFVSDYSDVERIYGMFNLTENVGEAGRLAIEAGIDVDMVGGWKGEHAMGETFQQLAREGKVSAAAIDRAAGNLLRMKFALGLFDRDLTINAEEAARRVAESQRENRALARQAARESLILLTNDGVLPLAAERLKRVALIGPNADRVAALFPMKYHNDVTPMVTVRAGLEARAQGRFEIVYAAGGDILGDDPSARAEAVRVALGADLVVVVVGETAVTGGTRQEQADLRATVGEEVDRADLGLPGAQAELVEAVLDTGKPTVVVLLNGRPLSIERIAARAGAILEAWGPGEEGGTAIAEVLFGEVNPGGRLPVTVARSVGQLPLYYNAPRWAEKRKAYVEQEAEPLFPFGHGLSYTTFAYDGLEGPEAVASGEPIRLSFTLENTGKRAGDEVVQVYVRDEIASAVRPVMELKAFRRVGLEPRARTRLAVEIPVEMLAFHDARGNYVVEPGRFELMIGASSTDIRLRTTITLTGEVQPVDYSRSYFSNIE